MAMKEHGLQIPCQEDQFDNETWTNIPIEVLRNDLELLTIITNIFEVPDLFE